MWITGNMRELVLLKKRKGECRSQPKDRHVVNSSAITPYIFFCLQTMTKAESREKSIRRLLLLCIVLHVRIHKTLSVTSLVTSSHFRSFTSTHQAMRASGPSPIYRNTAAHEAHFFFANYCSSTPSKNPTFDHLL